MDLKKEIKLSDLVRRPARTKQQGTRAFPASGSNGNARRSLSRTTRRRQVIGLKIGASQLAASRVMNGGSPQLLQLAREPLAPGIVSGGEVLDIPELAVALDSFFTKHELPRRGV